LSDSKEINHMPSTWSFRATAALVVAADLCLAGCLQAPPAPGVSFALDATDTLPAGFVADGASTETGAEAAAEDVAAEPLAEAEAPLFETTELFGDEPVYVLAAQPAAATVNGLGVYTRLRVMVTLDAVSFAKDPLGAPLKDVARVVVGVKGADYVLTQTKLSTTFTSGGRYVEVGAPVPNGDLVVAAQAIAKNGKVLATKTLTLPAKNRKAYVPLSLALKYPPLPKPPAPKPTPKPAALCTP
jgi:hypothetical protein